jgi:ATP-binding cassette subfamily B protein
VLLGFIMAQIAASLAGGHLTLAKRYTIYFLITTISATIIGVVGELIAVRIENNVYEKQSLNFFKRLTSKDMSFYRDHQGGYLVSLFRQHLDGLIILVRFLRVEVIRLIISLLAPTAVLLYVEWRLGLVTLVIVVVQLIYVVWSSAQANRYREMSHEIYRKVTGEVADVITNITAFKSSGVEEHAHRSLAKLSRQETHAFWLRWLNNNLWDTPRDLATGIGMAAALYVVLSVASGGSSSVGLIVLTLSYMFQINRSVGELPAIMKQHDELITKIHPSLRYLSSDYETIRDPAKPQKLRITKGAISLDHVSFRYPSDKQDIPVFHDLSIHIKGGERVGVVGLSGAGKSTLANLLMRFDEVTHGSITIDGTNIRDVRQSDLRRQIAYVPQEPLLFHRTIRENIAYFNDQVSDAAIIRAAKAAHAHDFISKLPSGYDSMVGERGVKLSGGQKQRVVIARAILKNAPIMIFDEATSALDTESEKIIQAALPQIIGKHTAIVIAHRLSTVAGLDRILVMHEGEIVESGTHDELLKLGKRYHSLWQKQINNS